MLKWLFDIGHAEDGAEKIDERFIITAELAENYIASGAECLGAIEEGRDPLLCDINADDRAHTWANGWWPVDIGPRRKSIMETRRISTPRLLYNHILTWCFAPSSIWSTLLHSRKNSVSIKSSIIEVLKTKYQFSSECGWKAIYLSNIKMIKIFFVCLTCLPHKCEYFQASILFTQSFRNPKAISFFKSPKHWKSVAPDRNFQSGQKIWPCCIVPTGQWTLWLFPSKDFSIYMRWLHYYNINYRVPKILLTRKAPLCKWNIFMAGTDFFTHIKFQALHPWLLLFQNHSGLSLK